MIQFKDDIEEAKERVNLWWDNKEADRPLIQIYAPRENPVYQVAAPEPKDIHDYWTNPEVVIPRLINTLGSTYFGGEAFPVMQPVPGRIVSITCKYLGAPNKYIDENTTWSEPIIDDWNQCPPLDFDVNNEWWKITMASMNAGAKAIKDQQLECFMAPPDLNGPTEVLSGLRNPEKMCIDMIMEPETVVEAARKVQKAWFEAWKGTTDISHQFGGYFTWMGVWSDLPATDLQSDFSSLISPEMFNDYVYPFIKEQSEYFPRSIFHLDGPDMIRHLDTLMTDEKINAIQWVQGAGAGKVSEWLDLMKRIQNGGKSLYIYCEEDEVPFLCDNLDAKGLMMVVKNCSSESKAKKLLKIVGKSGK